MTDETLASLEEILRRLLVFMLLLCGRMAPALALDAFQESAGEVVMQAERFDSTIARAGHDWTLQSTQSGASGSQYMTALPDASASYNTNYVTGSAELVYNVLFATTGTYYIWARALGPNGNGDTFHAGLDGTGPASADRVMGFNTAWKWSRSTMDNVSASITVATPGLHTVHVWIREDGLLLDKLLLRTSNSSTAPSGTGPSQSLRVTVGPPPDITAPTGTVTINNGAAATNNRQVILTLAATDNSGTVAQMECSNDGVTYAAAVPYATSLAWTLATGDGVKTVYVRFLDAAGNPSAPATDTITLDTMPPQITITTPKDGEVITAPPGGGS